MERCRGFCSVLQKQILGTTDKALQWKRGRLMPLELLMSFLGSKSWREPLTPHNMGTVHPTNRNIKLPYFLWIKVYFGCCHFCGYWRGGQRYWPLVPITNYHHPRLGTGDYSNLYQTPLCPATHPPTVNQIIYPDLNSLFWTSIYFQV